MDREVNEGDVLRQAYARGYAWAYAQGSQIIMRRAAYPEVYHTWSTEEKWAFAEGAGAGHSEWSRETN